VRGDSYRSSLAAVQIFVKEGTKVVINYIIAEKAERVVNEARALGVQALPILADVTNVT
jgi:NAD(P)-dependent dehydrogenase (short-subunit alcohol dehydrogenase family)